MKPRRRRGLLARLVDRVRRYARGPERWDPPDVGGLAGGPSHNVTVRPLIGGREQLEPRRGWLAPCARDRW